MKTKFLTAFAVRWWKTTRALFGALTASAVAAAPLWCNAAIHEAVLYSFSGCAVYYCTNGNRDGLDPTSALTADSAGNLYGTTQYGGNFGTGCYPSTCSTVFKLTRAGASWKKTTIYYFRGIVPNGVADGSYTTAGLLMFKGALYGTTYQGGSGTACPGGCGTVYRLTPPAAGQTLWNEQVLWSFTGIADAATPHSPLFADATGALYGTYLGNDTLFANGTGLGGVFKLTPPASGKTAWTEQVISNLGAGTIGEQPVAGVIGDAAGNLYAVATGNVYQNGPSAVVKLTPRNAARSLWTTTVLHQFTTTGAEGSYPRGGLVMDAKGNLYTTTSAGAGAGCIHRLGCGTVFELSPPANGGVPWNVHVLHTFTGGPDGGNSQAGLAMDSSGNLYGTTQYGGSTENYSLGSGVVFELAANGQFSVYALTGWCCSSIYGKPDHDGAFPFGAPLLANGALFGTSTAGGTNNIGAVFEISR